MNSLLDKFLRWWRFKKVVRFIPKGSVVCDVGCGREAYFLKKISNILEKGIGIDEKIDGYTDSKIKTIKTNISEHIPLESGSCDVVTMTAVLEHLSNPEEILKDSYRVLKEDGRLILTTPLPRAKFILEFLAFQLKLIDRGEIEDHKNYFSPKEIKEMLCQSGFDKKRIKISLFEFSLNSLIIAQK